MLRKRPNTFGLSNANPIPSSGNIESVSTSTVYLRQVGCKWGSGNNRRIQYNDNTLIGYVTYLSTRYLRVGDLLRITGIFKVRQ